MTDKGKERNVNRKTEKQRNEDKETKGEKKVK